MSASPHLPPLTSRLLSALKIQGEAGAWVDSPPWVTFLVELGARAAVEPRAKIVAVGLPTAAFATALVSVGAAMAFYELDAGDLATQVARLKALPRGHPVSLLNARMTRVEFGLFDGGGVNEITGQSVFRVRKADLAISVPEEQSWRIQESDRGSRRPQGVSPPSAMLSCVLGGDQPARRFVSQGSGAVALVDGKSADLADDLRKLPIAFGDPAVPGSLGDMLRTERGDGRPTRIRRLRPDSLDAIRTGYSRVVVLEGSEVNLGDVLRTRQAGSVVAIFDKSLCPASLWGRSRWTKRRVRDSTSEDSLAALDMLSMPIHGYSGSLSQSPVSADVAAWYL